MDKTLVFLDLDGVVTPYSSRSAYRRLSSTLDTFGYLRKMTVHGHNVDYSAELMSKMNSLKNKHEFEMKVLSSWNDRSLDVTSAMHLRVDGFFEWDADGGIPHDKYGRISLSDDELAEVRGKRKYALILRTLKANPRPFVWVDDEATVFYDGLDFTGALDVPHLVVAPDSRIGLAPKDLASMADFFESL